MLYKRRLFLNKKYLFKEKNRAWSSMTSIIWHFDHMTKVQSHMIEVLLYSKILKMFKYIKVLAMFCQKITIITSLNFGQRSLILLKKQKIEINFHWWIRYKNTVRLACHLFSNWNLKIKKNCHMKNALACNNFINYKAEIFWVEISSFHWWVTTYQLRRYYSFYFTKSSRQSQDFRFWTVYWLLD